MNRRTFLSSLAAAPALLSQATRPNVIVILSDDQGIGDVGCYGARDVLTPHLDRLAARGLRFTDWHASSPVCSPSRASVLTGKYPQHCGIPQILFSKPDFQVPGLRAGEHTLAGEFRGLGYRTGAIGKWHLGSAAASRPLAQGFDEFFGFYSGWIDYYSHRYYSLGGQPVFHDLWRDDREVWEEPRYQTEMLAEEARAFLTRQTAARPFFLYLAFGAPHYPMMAPAKYLDRFPATMDRDRRLHAAVVAALDDAIGSVMSELDKSAYLRNTIVFFQSDNGATHEVRADHAGRPYQGGSNGVFRGHKGSLFEGGMRVPAMLSWPGHLPAGKVVNEAACAIDLMPTLLALAGGHGPADVDGVDLSTALAGRAQWPARTLFWDYDGQAAVRSGQWKLIRNYREGLGEKLEPADWLSNLDADPRELTNATAQHPDRVRQLSEELAAWKRTWN